MALLLPVGYWRLIHVHRFPIYRYRSRSNREETGGDRMRRLVGNHAEVIKRKKKNGCVRKLLLHCFAPMTYDWQPERMHVIDGSRNNGKRAKRWSHLRIVRVEVPSGKSAG